MTTLASVAAPAAIWVASQPHALTVPGPQRFVSPMPFETAVAPAQPAGYETPLLMLALHRGTLPRTLSALDNNIGGAITRLLAAGDFTGKKDDVALLYPSGPAARVLLVGMGKPEEIDRSTIRRAASIAAKRARAAVYLPPEAGQVAPAEAGQAIAEGLAQGVWQYNEMKRPPEDGKKPALE